MFVSSTALRVLCSRWLCLSFSPTFDLLPLWLRLSTSITSIIVSVLLVVATLGYIIGLPFGVCFFSRIGILPRDSRFVVVLFFLRWRRLMVVALVPLERIAVMLLFARGLYHLVRLLLRHRAVFFALGLSLRVLRLALLDRRLVRVGPRLLR